MTFTLHQGWEVMSCQITHTNHQHTPLSPYIYRLSQHHITASQPSPGDNHQSTGGWSERTLGQAKIAAWDLFSYICTRALHSFRSFADCRAAYTVISLCTKPPSQHPSSITSVFLVPTLHLLPPSTPFWPYGTHPFFLHAPTINKISDLLYSLTPFLLQLWYAPLVS